ncbi:C1 family peptidase [Chengkuizengella sp. SCS-71B]|uniref:C1 family peptidase n=1 Tax=Chengkuizengella sp. SCS-71B TaxID=3115290 RepID=UPI0032C21175
MSNDMLNLDVIKRAISSNNAQWKAEESVMSLLPFEEKKLLLGATPPKGEPRAEEIEQLIISKKEKMENESSIKVPTTYDLRNVDGKNFVTDIKDQFKDKCGSCVAFGTIATVESSLRVQHNHPDLNVDLSEAHLFFCHGPECGAACRSGWWPTAALETFKNKGVVDEECYKYEDGIEHQDCSGLCTDSESRTQKIQGYTNLTWNPTQIKEWISSKGPVSACFVVYEDFFCYKSGIYKHCEGEIVYGHCVAIVGYNDNPGYWICKNSWSSKWGDQGFFKIAYGECAIDSWLNQGVIVN